MTFELLGGNMITVGAKMSPRGARQKEIVRDVTEKRSIRVSRIKKPAVSRQFFPFLHEA